MQTEFFKTEEDAWFYKLGDAWLATQSNDLGACVGAIVTHIVKQAYNAELANEIEKNNQHAEFQNYWNAVKDAHTLVHDDLTSFVAQLEEK